MAGMIAFCVVVALVAVLLIHRTIRSDKDQELSFEQRLREAYGAPLEEKETWFSGAHRGVDFQIRVLGNLDTHSVQLGFEAPAHLSARIEARRPDDPDWRPMCFEDFDVQGVVHQARQYFATRERLDLLKKLYVAGLEELEFEKGHGRGYVWARLKLGDELSNPPAHLRYLLDDLFALCEVATREVELGRAALAGMRCPYCRAEVATGNSLCHCEVCQTVHHTGCWKENGACSVFGCTSEQHLAIRVR